MPNSTPTYNIICLSNQIWDYPLWTNKRHVMSRLAKAGHKVLFVDPTINTGTVFLKHVLKKEWSLKRLATGVKQTDDLTVYSPLDFSPLHEWHAQKHAEQIRQLVGKNVDKTKKTILWVYNVELNGLRKYLDIIHYDLLIYDCVDNYPAFPRYNTQEKKKFIIEQENYLAKRANLIFATAPGLLDRLKKLNPAVFYMPNVGDFERFKDSKKALANPPIELKTIPHPIIGFTGAIDEYKFDSKLFRKLAMDFPGYSFVIIGTLALKDKEGDLAAIGLADLPNVYFLGTKPYDQLAKYVGCFDVAAIPYQVNDYTVGGCFPVKFHEELAAGLPVVVTDLPAYTPFAGVSYISKTYNEFSQNIRTALEEDSPEKIKERKEVAKDNTWDGKVKKMLKIIGDTINL
jgi:glycosyltransferase involved in cell wall biosynthesis